ncbi:hypothetical protein Y032_0042g601 [Ancylostoma ceylanicum]|uniref:Uncharacterized protein n=1 Tax=Ancylostoma ceylanicum TaxID=53326 RepID=A0A016UG82_9BILA|nr:hypothetical protein Y032_0042g601 [Ancylostoma ceylanicum]
MFSIADGGLDCTDLNLSLPYTIYLTAFAITPPINLDPHYIMFSSTPLTVQLKVKLTLTVAIALQRTIVRSTLILDRFLTMRMASGFIFSFSLP